MDPLSYTASLVAIASLSIQAYSALTVLYFEEYSTLRKTYGKNAAFVLSVVYRNTASEYARIEQVVLRGDDNEALLFRNSVATESNMTAVAVSVENCSASKMMPTSTQGAIIAQVALTALSLPNLSLAHWTARAFLLFATVAGCLSVYYACKLQRTVGKLYRPEMVRRWLTVGSRWGVPELAKNRKAALSAVFLLSAPYTMMSYSILAFVTGLAIYQGFTWTRNLDTAAGATNSRNVFIAYIVSTGYCQIFFLSVDAMKHIEDWINFGSIRVRPTVSPEEQLREPRRTGGQDQAGDPLRMEDHPVPDVTINSPSPSPTATESPVQTANAGIAVASLSAVLEAAARAHEASAEADRRVASAYRSLYKERNLPTTHHH